VHPNKIEIKNDTIHLDTLSIVPGSFILRASDGTLLDTSYYKISYADAKVILNKKKFIENNISSDNLKPSFKTFPYLFSKETKHKDISRIKPDLFGIVNPFSYNIESKNDDIFKMDGLNKTGSISRGFTVGNNQDMVVNSNLNLQLSGHLSNNVDILLAATDNNIPIQAEGNTQKLQEFDKVFIQLSNSNSKLIAGDFQMIRPYGYFMSYNKKAQGASFSTIQKVRSDNKDKTKQGIYKTSFGAAVSRGKFSRNIIQGVEGNQGPYRLHGAENETYIIILSGTEKIYIDGRLVERGQENDYVINYNTGELTFTAKQFITKDKRIVAEFQYSDKNYLRSIVTTTNEYEQNKIKLHLHVYSEQDSKNQPLNQSLSNDQKRLLSRIGDTLSLAVSPSYDTVTFNNNEVLYHISDTLNGVYYFSKIFVYSPSKVYKHIVNDSSHIYVQTHDTSKTLYNHKIKYDSVHYRVGFSYVGEGKGNYRQINSSANGKVFQWVMPDETTNPATPKGNYEPVIQLIAPKKKQMVTAGFDYAINKNTHLSIEGAISKNDINTFSSIDKYDDVGYALKMNFDNKLQLSQKNINDTTKKGFVLLSNLNYEYVQKYFTPVERYRTTEFERDWNRTSTTAADDQHIIGATIGIENKSLGMVGYKFNTFLEGNKYDAYKHGVDFIFNKKGFTANYNGSLLTSRSTPNSDFYRHKSGISQKIKKFTVGLKDEFEQNKFFKDKKDSLLSNSYKFWEWQAYIQNADTTKNRYGINYKQRTDYAVKDSLGVTSLNKSTFAESYGGFLELMKKANNQLKLNTTYRKLSILNNTLTSQPPDNTLVGRVEYNFRLWKGLLFSSSYYEIGSGLEVKKEYSFLQVAPGLGVYQWIDLNNNNIKELDEFFVAAFPDQATYIKVYTPTNNYIHTYTNQFSEVLNLKPAAIWASKKGFKKFLSKFSNQTSYRVDRKSTETDLAKAYNPFLNETNDSTLLTLNSSFRNTLFINQMGSTFGLDISYQDNRNKTLLVNGIDAHKNNYLEERLRWNITKEISFNLNGKGGLKSSSSQYFPAHNYSITYYEAEPKLNYQPNTSFRTSISFKYTDKKNENDLGGQYATLQDYGAEVKYNVLNKGSLNLKADYIQIKYKDDLQNASLAFEMLDALKVGQNMTWGISYQRNLSNNLQLSITYDGRKSEGTKAIHTGGAQIRAYF
jgi:hypothetical protein